MSAPPLPLRAPSLRLRALENLVLARGVDGPAVATAARLRARGDGHPVLVLPGFTASDTSTWYLRNVLRAKGYAAHGWGLGTNIGPHPRIVRGIQRRLLGLAERHGRTVSLVGWSLGGDLRPRARPAPIPQLVRERRHPRQPVPLARRRPQHRRRASTAGWPRGDDPVPGSARPRAPTEPLPVPATSIYTRTDGVVRWHACIDAIGPTSENIEVRGTHSGLGVNAAALLRGGRSARPARGHVASVPAAPPSLAQLYPTPASWEPRWADRVAASRLRGSRRQQLVHRVRRGRRRAPTGRARGRGRRRARSRGCRGSSARSCSDPALGDSETG